MKKLRCIIGNHKWRPFQEIITNINISNVFKAIPYVWECEHCGKLTLSSGKLKQQQIPCNTD